MCGFPVSEDEPSIDLEHLKQKNKRKRNIRVFEGSKQTMLADDRFDSRTFSLSKNKKINILIGKKKYKVLKA